MSYRKHILQHCTSLTFAGTTLPTRSGSEHRKARKIVVVEYCVDVRGGERIVISACLVNIHAAATCILFPARVSILRIDSVSMLGTHNLPKQAYTTSAISFGRKTLPSRGTRRSTSCCGVRTALGKACKFRTVGRSTRHVRCLSKAGEEFPIRPKKRSDWELGPAFDLSQEQAVCMQLKVEDC